MSVIRVAVAALIISIVMPEASFAAGGAGGAAAAIINAQRQREEDQQRANASAAQFSSLPYVGLRAIGTRYCTNSDYRWGAEYKGLSLYCGITYGHVSVLWDGRVFDSRTDKLKFIGNIEDIK